MRGAYRYEGDLRQTTLPEMLYTIYHYRVPGTIEATRSGVVKRVHVSSGNVIHAASSDREDSLGAFLFHQGRLTEEQYAASMAARARTAGARYGSVLVEMGLLSPAEVQRAVRAQIESIVWSLFAWEEGMVTFDISESPDIDSVRLSLPMRQVILEGIKRALDPKSMLQRMGRKETVYEPSFAVDDLIELGLEKDDYDLLRMVDGKRTLLEVCTHGPLAPPDNARLLYGFHVLQLVQRSVTATATVAPRAPDTGVIKVRLKTADTGDFGGGSIS